MRKTLNAKDSHWPWQDSNQAPPKYRLRALSSNQAVWYHDSWFADIKHSHFLPQLTCILHFSNKIPGNINGKYRASMYSLMMPEFYDTFVSAHQINPGSTRAKSTFNHCNSTLMCLHILSVMCASLIKRHTMDLEHLCSNNQRAKSVWRWSTSLTHEGCSLALQCTH